MGLIITEVFADAVNEKLGVALKMGLLATNVTEEVAEITEQGDKIHFPKYERVASVGEVTKGTALVPATVSMTDNEATIKQTGGSIRVYDKDAKQIKGRTFDNMAKQLSNAMAKDLDSSLSATMLDEVTRISPCASADAITNDELLNAFALFGDDIDTNTFKGIAINSKLVPSFLSMDEFVSTGKTYQATDNGIIKEGVIGYWLGGIPVLVTNNGTYDTTNTECVTYMVKEDALGYVMQDNVSLEVEREGKLLANDIIVSDMYATKVMDTDGIVILRKTTS